MKKTSWELGQIARAQVDFEKKMDHFRNIFHFIIVCKLMDDEKWGGGYDMQED